MEFEWDQQKRLDVIAKRGVDFRKAALIFLGPVITKIDNRRDYGEVRLISMGLFGDECFVVVHTARHDKIRIISAWLGGHREREQCRALYAGGTQDDV